MEDTKRTVYLDYLRVFAAASVMLLHVVGQQWYSVALNSFDWEILNFYDSFVRWCIDAFLMISGVLFLSKEEVSVKKIFTKYVSRMLIAYFTWSFVYYLFDGASISSQVYLLFCKHNTGSIVSLLKGHLHLWFILAISGIYISLPIIRQVTRNEKVSIYFLLLSLIFYCLIPEVVSIINDFAGQKLLIIEAFDGFIQSIRPQLVMSLVCFPILGYELSRHTFSKKTRIAIYFLGVVGCLITFVMTQCVSVMSGSKTEAYYGSATLNVLFAAIAVFELFKSGSFKKDRLNKCMATLSKWSFGAYLVHMLFVEMFDKIGFNAIAFCPVLSVPVVTFVVFVCSFTLSALLHSIPILKKYIV